MNESTQAHLDSLRLSKRDRTSIRAIFGRWLAVAIAVALVIAAIMNYTNVTAAELDRAESVMRAELDYLSYQIGRSDAEAAGQLLQGYTGTEAGIVVLADKGLVVSSNDERIDAGQPLDAVFDKNALMAIENSVRTGSLRSFLFNPEGRRGEAACLLAANTDAGTVIIILPEETIFAERIVALASATLASALLLAAIYVTVRLLLRVVVISRIDKTNAVLARITAGELDARVEERGSKEFRSLSNGINETVDALNGWIAEANARMESELSAAKAIQESALPREFPAFPEIDQFDLYATMKPARVVGGDFYDFFLLGDSDAQSGKLAFVLADVSGKSVPAALFMMRAKTQIHSCLVDNMSLADAVAHVNNQLCEDNEAGMFVTAWIGVLDYETWRIEVVNAGHNPPLLRENGSWRWLSKRSGVPLGIFEGVSYKPFTLECAPGNTLVIYSDGVTEAMNTEEKLYGEPRLATLVQGLAQLDSHGLADAILADVAAHAEGAEQSDDITVLALKLGKSSAS